RSNHPLGVTTDLGIDENTGIIKTARVLDRETRDHYSFIAVTPEGITVEVNIQVNDINDHAPAFPKQHSTFQIPEHTPIENLKPGSSILQVFASDADEGDNGDVVYEINRRQSDPDQYFTIDSRTGVTTAFVTIHVRDYNDNQPTMTIIFLSEDGSPQISEGAQPGQYVARISVSDPDYGEYSNVNVTLEGGDGKFALTTKDNIIYLICVDQLLDREERDSYDLRVTATDSGTPPLRAESAFVLQVMDINDNPPLFDQQEYKQSIPEVVYPGSFVLQVTARDKDQGPNGEVRYSIVHGRDTHSSWFAIDPATGIITTAAPLDYEKDPQPQLTVLATDRGSPALSSSAVVHVALQDVNDNEPVFRSNFYNVSLKENIPVGTCFLQVGTTVGSWHGPGCERLGRGDLPLQALWCSCQGSGGEQLQQKRYSRDPHSQCGLETGQSTITPFLHASTG
uniref:Cadherin domain-containing protein n=1 Tax=Bubo bubo TaxID=30461 RepID=A0A8C0FQY8_BUBBB